MGRRRKPLSTDLRVLSERMRAVAAAQGGIVTAAECAGLGADASAIRTLLGTGAWRRARRGVYRDPCYRTRQVPDTEHHARCAALLAGLAAGSAVVSHASAARLLGLPLRPRLSDDVVITRTPPAPANPLGARSRVHVARFDGDDVVGVAGCRCSPGRGSSWTAAPRCHRSRRWRSPTPRCGKE